MSADEALRERLAEVLLESVLRPGGWEAVRECQPGTIGHPIRESYLDEARRQADALLPLIHAERDKARAEALHAAADEVPLLASDVPPAQIIAWLRDRAALTEDQS